jgi:hypothetical protein
MPSAPTADSASNGTQIANTAWVRTNVTNLINSGIGTTIQGYDSDLGAIAGLSTTGLIARTGTGTMATRTIVLTGDTTYFTGTNLDGVAGAPTINLQVPAASTSTAGKVQFSTDAESYAGTSAAKSPSVQTSRSLPGIGQAWVVFTAANPPVILQSYNCSGVSRISNGRYKATWSYPFIAADYVVVENNPGPSTGNIAKAAQDNGSYTVDRNTNEGNPSDGDYKIALVAFGQVNYAGSATSGPTITSFTPTTGITGTSVVISGTGFTGVTGVNIGNVAAGFTYISSVQINATVGGSATTGPVTVTTPNGTASGPSNFVVIPGAPTITSFTPTSGVVGTVFSITGTNFTGATSVKVNTTESLFVVNSATQITANVPTGSTTGTVKVTTPGGTATGASFTVN